MTADYWPLYVALDIVLGPTPIDRSIAGREMFIPQELARGLAGGDGGRPMGRGRWSGGARGLRATGRHRWRRRRSAHGCSSSPGCAVGLAVFSASAGARAVRASRAPRASPAARCSGWASASGAWRPGSSGASWFTSGASPITWSRTTTRTSCCSRPGRWRWPAARDRRSRSVTRALGARPARSSPPPARRRSLALAPQARLRAASGERQVVGVRSPGLARRSRAALAVTSVCRSHPTTKVTADVRRTSTKLAIFRPFLPKTFWPRHRIGNINEPSVSSSEHVASPHLLRRLALNRQLLSLVAASVLGLVARPVRPYSRATATATTVPRRRAVAPPPATTQEVAPGGYYVDGNTVCTSAGVGPPFHGVDRPSLEWAAGVANLSTSDFQLMAGWKPTSSASR